MRNTFGSFSVSYLSTAIQFVKVDCGYIELLRVVYRIIWLKSIHEETLTESAPSEAPKLASSFLYSQGLSHSRPNINCSAFTGYKGDGVRG